MQAPPIDASFADKMAYYRVQHTSKGVNVTHQIGTQIIVFGLRLLFAKPRLRVPMFVGGPTLQIAGHRWFEQNMLSTHKGWITYQLTDVIQVLETYGEMLASRAQHKVASAAPTDAITGARPATMAA